MRPPWTKAFTVPVVFLQRYAMLFIPQPFNKSETLSVDFFVIPFITEGSTEIFLLIALNVFKYSFFVFFSPFFMSFLHLIS